MIVKILHGTKIHSIYSMSKYVKNDKKCMKPIVTSELSSDSHLQEEMDVFANSLLEQGSKQEQNIFGQVQRMMQYSSNEHKTEKKYISGYLCDPENSEEDFKDNIAKHMQAKGKTLADVTGHVVYHLIQSFPEELEISNEEVHQCGIELAQKLGVYQCLICSHVHPEITEDGEVKGKSKHNHIIMNAYRLYDLIDPTHPNKIKYHDCKDSYNQLQIWNDEIAIAHGLPIIIEPDNSRTYSWYEAEQANVGKSWLEGIRYDIESSQRISQNWEQFVKHMENKGYQIRDGKTLTYIAPDYNEKNHHRVRATRLGKEYTKDFIQKYFEIMKEIRLQSAQHEEDPSTHMDLTKLFQQNHNELYIKLVKEKAGKHASKVGNQGKQYTVLVPLEKNLQPSSVYSYFERNKIYEICNQGKNTVGHISGKELFAYYQDMNEEQQRKQQQQLDIELYDFDNHNFAYHHPTRSFYNKQWIHPRTKVPYSIDYYSDIYAYRRSSIELIFILAMLIIDKESLQFYGEMNASSVDDVVYAKRDWKLQNMTNALTIARENKIHTLPELRKRLDLSGKKIAQVKRDYFAKQKVLANMEPIKIAIDTCNQLEELCTNIYAMPISKEKDELLLIHKEAIEQYKNSKALLYQKNCQSSEQQADFLNRYYDLESKISYCKDAYDVARNEYRNLKKLEYHLKLAQNDQYVCGPTYDYQKVKDTPYEKLHVNMKSEDELFKERVSEK